MAKVYSWEVSKTPKQYAYIVHPNDTSKAYIGSELEGENLQKIIDWASTCTDTEYEAQFEKMKNLCVSKNYDVEFETVTAYMDVRSSCDNLRGPAGRGIDRIALYDDDAVTNISTYIIYYDDGTTDTFEVRNGKDGKDGIDGKPGTKGDSGVSSKFIMVYTSGRDADGNLFTPERPTGGSYDFVLNEATYPTGWDPNDSEKTPPIWMSSRTFASTEASTDKQWSIPIQITGESGEPGVDGITTEFIYLLDTEKPNIEKLPSENKAGYVPTGAGWTGSPTGVDEDNPVEWCCIRRYENENKKWGAWEGPTIWSKYGVNGQDGDGVQYIYLRNKGSLPKNPTPLGYNDPTSDMYSAYQDKHSEWIPQEGSYKNYKNETVKTVNEGTVESPIGIWTDNPTDVTNDYKYLWVSSRKYRASQANNKIKEWTKFSDPALWSKFGEDGKNATSIRKIYALSDSTSNPPTLPADSVITGDWGTGFPKDYESGVNVVWGSEAEIWAHNFEFVKSYKLASSKDKDGNVIEPDDLNNKNWVEVLYLPDEENISYKYLKFNDEYYSWQGGWCEPYLVTGLKGDNGQPIDYTTYVFAYGYTDFIPEPPSGTSPNNPGYSIDGNGNTIIWEDFPNTTGGRVDGAKDEDGNEKRWYQCTGHVDGRTNSIKEWGAVTPCSGRDGEALPGKYTEIRFGVTEDDVKPDVIEYNEYGDVIREPILLNSQGEQWGWYSTDLELPDIPKGGTMWQIWALIDGTTNEVIINNGKGWNGPRRVSGEKGEQGLQGPAGLRGVTGIPGATSNQMYCLGTLDEYFGSDKWKEGVLPEEMTDWYPSHKMPYSDVIDVTNETELLHIASQSKNDGRVARWIRVTKSTVNKSTFYTTTHQYYLMQGNTTYKKLTEELPEDEEYNVYVWCIQGNDVWKAGKAFRYVEIEKPDDTDEINTIIVDSLPDEQNELYKYLICNDKYYEWKEIDGDKVEHTLQKIDWSQPFKLQGTNGLRGLVGNRGQVVYPMGIYNHEEVYITTDKKAPYVYDPNDGLFYVYNIVDEPWVGQLPENYKEIKNDDGTYKYSIDGSGNENTWMTDQDGDTPANNFANAENEMKSPAWVRFESFQALYTSIGIIANGMIGSAVYNNEFMFSQQGIDSDGNPTNYAANSTQSYESGFLSGYDYDESKKQWKYKGTSTYISNFDVDPYELDKYGKPIHTFRPNVCINFSTGQMWLSTGQIKFGQLSRNISTNDEISKTYTTKGELKVEQDKIAALVTKTDALDTTLSGINIEDSFTSLFTQMKNDGKIVSKAEISTFVSKDDDGFLESGVKIKADKIDFIGKTVINGKFSVDTDGNVTLSNATVTGRIDATSGSIGGFDIESDKISSNIDVYFQDMPEMKGSKTVNISPGGIDVSLNSIQYMGNIKMLTTVYSALDVTSAGRMTTLRLENTNYTPETASNTTGMALSCTGKSYFNGLAQLSGGITLGSPCSGSSHTSPVIVTDKDVTLLDTSNAFGYKGAIIFIINKKDGTIKVTSDSESVKISKKGSIKKTNSIELKSGEFAMFYRIELNEWYCGILN